MCDENCNCKNNKMEEALNILAQYFISGNCIPVERATINTKDFWQIIDEHNIEIKGRKDNVV